MSDREVDLVLAHLGEDAYPLRPIYPGGGEHWLSGWYTYNEGYHVLVARTREKLERLAWIAAEREEAEKLLPVQRITIVSPPATLVEQVRRLDCENTIRQLKSYLKYTADQCGWRVPPTMRRCKEYEPLDLEPDEQDPKGHYGCTKCDGDLVLVNERILPLAVERFAYGNGGRQRWQKTVEKLPSRPTTPPANPERPLYVVRQGAARNGKGTGAELAKAGNIAIHASGFFFHEDGEPLPPPEGPQAVIAERKAALEAKEKKAEEERRARAVQYPRDQQKELEDLLAPAESDLEFLSVLKARSEKPGGEE